MNDDIKRRRLAAERQRWHRRRQRRGRRAFTLYLADGFVEQAVSAGLITPEEAANKRLISGRFGNILESQLFS